MVGVNTICRIYSAIHDNSERMPLKQQFSRSTFLADRMPSPSFSQCDQKCTQCVDFTLF